MVESFIETLLSVVGDFLVKMRQDLSEINFFSVN